MPERIVPSQSERQCEATTLADERCIRLATHTYQVVAGRVEYLCCQHTPQESRYTKEIIVSEITEAAVMYREVARVGSRVKHYGQRFTGSATATVAGFRNINPPECRPWINVLVKTDRENDPYGSEWDYDRTELITDVG